MWCHLEQLPGLLLPAGLLRECCLSFFRCALTSSFNGQIAPKSLRACLFPVKHETAWRLPAHTLWGGLWSLGPGRHQGGRGWTVFGTPVKVPVHLSVFLGQLVQSTLRRTVPLCCLDPPFLPPGQLLLSASVSPSLGGCSGGKDQGLIRMDPPLYPSPRVELTGAGWRVHA